MGMQWAWERHQEFPDTPAWPAQGPSSRSWAALSAAPSLLPWVDLMIQDGQVGGRFMAVSYWAFQSLVELADHDVGKNGAWLHIKKSVVWYTLCAWELWENVSCCSLGLGWGGPPPHLLFCAIPKWHTLAPSKERDYPTCTRVKNLGIPSVICGSKFQSEKHPSWPPMLQEHITERGGHSGSQSLLIWI